MRDMLLNDRKLYSWKEQAIALQEFVEGYKASHDGKTPSNAEIIAAGIKGLKNAEAIRTCFNNIEALK